METKNNKKNPRRILGYLMALAMMVFSINVSAQCDHTLTMMDAYGDGWNGATVSVSVNGTLVADSAACTGSSDDLVFSANTGDVITFAWISGTYDSEISWDLTDVNGTSLGSGAYGDDGTSNGAANCVLPTTVDGCTDSTAVNYDPAADTDDGSCVYCTDNYVTLECGGGSWGSEVSWNLLASDGSVVLSGGAPYSSNACLPNDCYTVDMADAYGDGWNGNVFEMTLGGGSVGTATLVAGASGSSDLALGTSCPVYGCTDATAFNYDAAADTDDGSCYPVIYGCFDTLAVNYALHPAVFTGDPLVDANTSDATLCNYCTDNTVTVSFYDSYGDGWNGATMNVYDYATGDSITSGTLGGGSFYTDNLCLVDGCYEVVVGGGSWDSEITFDFGSLTGAATGSYLVSVGAATCPILGCMDPTALNYDATATVDDGSCGYLCDQYVASASVVSAPSCAGAYDASAEATIAGSFGNDFWLWDNGSDASTLTGVPAGTYSCTITDAAFTIDTEFTIDTDTLSPTYGDTTFSPTYGDTTYSNCSSTVSVTIDPTPAISLVGTTFDATPGNSNGGVDIAVSGGTPCYLGDATVDASVNATASIWLGNVFDVIADQDLQINSIAQPTYTGTGTIYVYYKSGSSDGFETADSAWTLAGTAPAAAAFNGDLTDVPVNINVNAGDTVGIYVYCDGLYLHPNGNYYSVYFGSDATDAYTDVANTDGILSITYGRGAGTQPGGVVTTGNGSETFCGTVSYGLATYNYAWSTGDTTQNVTGLPLGPVDVTVTDCNGCTSVASWFILTNNVYGCMDPNASNYDGSANTACDSTDNNSLCCLYDGCTDSTATNYDPSYNNDDGSCTYNCMHPNSGSWDDELTLTLTPDWNTADISYQVTNAFTGDTVFTSPAYGNGGAVDEQVLCAMDGCYFIDGFDSAGDGWGTLDVVDSDGNSLGALSVIDSSGRIAISVGGTDCTLGCMDTSYTNYNVNAIIDDGSCADTIVGCTDPNAINYTPYSNSDDGSCCYGDILTLNLYDSYGDGWGWAGLENSVTIYGVDYTLASGSSGSFEFCGDITACDSLIFNADASYSNENSWDITDASGTVLGSGGNTSGVFGFCPIYGCTDSTATNYDANATDDDGSCCSANVVEISTTMLYLGSYAYDWSGFVGPWSVTDPLTNDTVLEGANNYDPTGALGFNGDANSGCLPDGCYEFSAINYGSYGAFAYVDLNGTVYQGAGLGGTWNFEDIYFTVGNATCPIFGCTDSTASNYDPAADADNGSCTYPCLDNEVLYTSGSYAGENSFTITDCDGNVLAEMLSGIDGFDNCIALPAIYSVNLVDSWGDSWNGGFLTIDGDTFTLDGVNDDGVSASFQVGVCPVYGCTDPTAANYDPAADTDDGSCTYGIPGCIDALACNYDSTATADDGSCTYAVAGFDCAGNCLNGGTAVAITVGGGSWGSEVSWDLLASDGSIVLSGGAPYSSTECLVDDCYTLAMSDAYGDGWNGNSFIAMVDTNVVGLGTLVDGFSGSFDFSLGGVACPVYGCTDSTAANYDSAADTDDGSCDYLGCTNPTATNYDANATIDDGSCTFGCSLDLVTVTLYDSYGDGGGEITVDGNVLTNLGSSNSMTLCLDLATCYDVLYVATDGWSYENSWDVVDAAGVVIASGADASGQVGNCFVQVDGCTDPAASNYDPLANTDDGSCTYCVDGCTDPTAFNYDANATCDDGSCVPVLSGCTDPAAANYNANVNTDDGSCEYPGCTNPAASNYDPNATIDDGSCIISTTCSGDAITGLFVSDIIDDRCVLNFDNMNTYDANGTQICRVDQIRIKYRPVGSSGWSQKNIASPTGYDANGTCNSTQKTDKNLYGLTLGTEYEWEVKVWYCSGQTTGWAPGPNFTTAPECPNGGNFDAYGVNSTKARFTWDDSNGAFEFLRIKIRVDSISNPVASDFIQVGGAGVTYGTFVKDKNGLTPGETYRGQGRTWCNPNGGAYNSLGWGSFGVWTQPANRIEGGSSIANLDVYPNPSRDVFNVTFTSEDVQDLEVRVVNIVGEVVYTEDLQQFVGEYTKLIDLATYTKGVYFLEITTDNGVVNKKLILQ